VREDAVLDRAEAGRDYRIPLRPCVSGRAGHRKGVRTEGRAVREDVAVLTEPVHLEGAVVVFLELTKPASKDRLWRRRGPARRRRQAECEMMTL
jgi:hypothetical protein